MPGIRIQHETERNCTLTLVDGKRLYPEPWQCPTCGRLHTHKTYHLILDETGAVLVSTEIVERLKALPLMGGFRIANVVESPPEQRVVVAARIDRPQRPIGPPVLVHPTLREPI